MPFVILRMRNGDTRHAVLCDLSPEATFIAYNYNHQFNIDMFEKEATTILEKIKGGVRMDV